MSEIENRKSHYGDRSEAMTTPSIPMFGSEDRDSVYYRLGIKNVSMAAAKSALQKAIRRNDVEVARYCAGILVGSHHIANLMHRLLTIASEDIGLACNDALAYAVGVYDEYDRTRTALDVQAGKGNKGWRDIRNDESTRVMIDRLVKFMCEAPKSREMDNVCVGVYSPIYDALDAGTPMQDARERFATALESKNYEDALVASAWLMKTGNTDSAIVPILNDFVAKKTKESDVVTASVVMATLSSISTLTAKKKTKGSRPPMLPIAHAICALTTDWWKKISDVVASRNAIAGTRPSEEELSDARELYERLVDPRIPARDFPEYTYDMHVRGYREGDVSRFVREENDALSPKGSIPDLHLEVALTTGSRVREDCQRQKIAASREKAKASLLGRKRRREEEEAEVRSDDSKKSDMGKKHTHHHEHQHHHHHHHRPNKRAKKC